VDLPNFEKLEVRIDKIIQQNASLKRQNNMLLAKLCQKDQDINKLADNIGKLSEERDSVYARVVQLLDKLDNIDISE